MSDLALKYIKYSFAQVYVCSFVWPAQAHFYSFVWSGLHCLLKCTFAHTLFNQVYFCSFVWSDLHFLLRHASALYFDRAYTVCSGIPLLRHLMWLLNTRFDQLYFLSLVWSGLHCLLGHTFAQTSKLALNTRRLILLTRFAQASFMYLYIPTLKLLSVIVLKFEVLLTTCWCV